MLNTHNLKKVLSKGYDTLMPSAEQLLEASKPDWKTKTIGDTEYEYPDHGIGAEDIRYKIKKTDIGQFAIGRVYLSDGTVQGFTSNVLSDIHRSRGQAYTFGQGAPWLTPTRSILERMNTDVAYEDKHDTIKLSTRNGGKEILTLGALALFPYHYSHTLGAALNHTLCKGAQAKQAAMGKIITEFDLPPNQYRRGVSMDGNELAFEPFYVDQGEIGHSHISVPSAFHKLEVEDLGRFVEWSVEEAKGTARLACESIRSGDIRQLLGTFSLNPHFVTQSVVGNMRSLGSGAAGDMYRGAPTDTHRTVSVHGNDRMSHAGEPQLFGGSQTYVNIHDGVCHVDAVNAAANERDLAVLRRYDEVSASGDGTLSEADRAYVSTIPGAQVTHLPNSLAA